MAGIEEKLSAAALAAANEHSADIIFYSGGIEDRGFGEIAKAIAVAKHHSRAILILTTNGGQANSAYQIARLFQRTYDDFWIFTPSYCKSAGTLVALGAHQLLMDHFSELGPLDVQLMKENEIIGRKSGLLARSSFESLQEFSFELFESFMLRLTVQSQGQISFKLASQLSATMASNLMAPIYGQINPDVVGGDYRDLNVALHYGDRLVEHSQNARESTVMHLIKDYPSHDFIIDDIEAKKLFKKVETPSETLYALVGLLGDPAYNEQRELDVRPLTLRKAFVSKEQPKDGKGNDDQPEPETETPGPLDGGGGTNRGGDQASAVQVGDDDGRVIGFPQAAPGE
jgi:hypothetical protein